VDGRVEPRTVRFSDRGCEAALEGSDQRVTSAMPLTPALSPRVGASGEREGPAERDGEGRQAMDLGRFGEESRLTGQPWVEPGDNGKVYLAIVALTNDRATILWHNAHMLEAPLHARTGPGRSNL
jgi:hypothetical protein